MNTFKRVIAITGVTCFLLAGCDLIGNQNSLIESDSTSQTFKERLEEYSNNPSMNLLHDSTYVYPTGGIDTTGKPGGGG